MTTKVLQPDRYVIEDKKPCSACTEDIVLEQELKECMSGTPHIQIPHRPLKRHVVRQPAANISLRNHHVLRFFLSRPSARTLTIHHYVSSK